MNTTIFFLMVSFVALGGAAPLNATQQVRLTLQRRSDDDRVEHETVTVDPSRTAVVVIDMWDQHWCNTYTRRVGNLVPRMNQVLAAARHLGMQVVFAPSHVLAVYEAYPQRAAMVAVPQHPIPGRVEFSPQPRRSRRTIANAAWTNRATENPLAPGASSIPT